MASVVARVLLLLALVSSVAAGAASYARADAPLGGPVILGGDDLTDHGCVDDQGAPRLGWLYLTRAISDLESRAGGGGGIAALGSSVGEDPSEFLCAGSAEEGFSQEVDGDAGTAIGLAAAAADLSVTYYDGGAAIEQFFRDLAAGQVRPKIIWISGTGADNDLSENDVDEIDERGVLAENATKLGDFVNSGGGLMSHGTNYDWLVGLLPELNHVSSGGCQTPNNESEECDDLYRTAEGVNAFPNVSDADFNAGPWHNHFEGDFGGLEVLVRSQTVDDESSHDAAVIIGGAAVTLPGSITLEPATAEKGLGEQHTVTATLRDGDGAFLVERNVDFDVISGPNDETPNGQGETNSQGQATFRYDGDGGPGTDTIQASFLDETETPRTATATVTWGNALSIDDVSVDEGEEAVFTITITPACDCVVTVEVATRSIGSASDPDDYVGVLKDTIEFDGEETRTFTVQTNADQLAEPDEMFEVVLSNADGAEIVDGVGIGTIRGTAAPPAPPPVVVVPSISIGDVLVPESGSVITAAFPVRLSQAGSQRITVDYTTVDGTGKAASDYVAAQGTLAFEPGEVSKTVPVTISDDRSDEPDETFIVRLSNPSNAVIGHATGTATVRDDADPPPTVSVVDVTVVEGNPGAFFGLTAGPTFAVFTLALSEPSGYVVTADYATADGTARGGTDYTPTSGTATFQPGQTTQTVAVPVTPNSNDELDRSFFLRVGGGTNNAGSTDGEAQATIQDDDDPPPPVAGESGNGSVKTGTILIKLPGTDVFVTLTGAVQLPIGTVVDATRGTVILEMSDGAGGTYTGEFSAGIFTILEQTLGVVRTLAGSHAKKPKKKKKKTVKLLFTTLRLEGGNFGICTTPRTLAGPNAKKPKPKAVRRLWGDSKGKFRTKGRHSAATVRGTRWLTSDRCDGTLTYVAQGGPVSVLDFRLGRTIELRQGQTYVAKPRGRR